MTQWLQWIGLEDGADAGRIVDGQWRAASPMSDFAFWSLVVVGSALALMNFLPAIRMRKRVRVITFVLRAAMLAVLLTVLSRVEWRVNLEMNRRPQWVVLLDDSASMSVADADGKSRWAAAREDLEKLRKAAQGKATLAVSTFNGSSVDSADAGQGPTRFGDAVAKAALSRDRPDRLLILSDGRDSEGRDPASLGEDLAARGVRTSVRVYGSQRPPEAAALAVEPERNLLRLGEELAVRGSVLGARAVAGRQFVLKENGKEVKRVAADTAASSGRFEMRHVPKTKGRHVYTVELVGGSGRAPTAVFSADVLAEKINVLLIEGFPRFEFKLFKSVLEVDPLVNLVSVCFLPGGGVYVQGAPMHRNPDQGLVASQADLFKYDVVILRDVPRALFREGGDTSESRLRALVEFVVKRGGGLMVCGGRDVYRAGGYGDSALAEILPFDLSNKVSGDDQFDGLFHVSIPRPAFDHPLLRLLNDPADNRERLTNLRRLDGSNNVGRFKPSAVPLMTRTIQVKTKTGGTEDRVSPVLGAINVGDGKVVGAAVDTLWRWQLQPEFADPPLTMLLANIVRWLAPPPGRRPGLPDVSGAGAPQVGRELLLSTDLRDENFDPITGADLAVTAVRPDGSQLRLFPLDLPEEPGRYEYRVPLDQAGAYKVTARYGKNETVREFVAGTAAGELADLSADPAAAARLAKTAEGEVIAGRFDDWLASADWTPRAVPAVRDLEVWNSLPVLALFLALVAADCWIRKRQGLA